MPDENMLNVVMGIAVDAKEYQEMKDMRDILKDIAKYQDEISAGKLPSFNKSGTISTGTDAKRIEADLSAIEKKTSTDAADVKKGISNSIMIGQHNTGEILSSINMVQSNIYIKVNELISKFNNALHTNVSFAEKERFVKEQFTEDYALKAAQSASALQLSPQAMAHLGVSSRDEFNQKFAKILYSTSGEVEGKSLEQFYNLVRTMEGRGVNVAEILSPMLNIAGESSRTLRGLGMKTGETRFGSKDVTLASTYESLDMRRATATGMGATVQQDIMRKLEGSGATEKILSNEFIAEATNAKDIEDLKLIMSRHGLTPDDFNMGQGSYVYSQGASKYLYQLQGQQSASWLSSQGFTQEQYAQSYSNYFPDIAGVLSPNMISKLSRTMKNKGDIWKDLIAEDPSFANIPKENKPLIEELYKHIIDITKSGQWGFSTFEGKNQLKDLSQIGKKDQIGKQMERVMPMIVGEIEAAGVSNLYVPNITKKTVSGTDLESTQKSYEEGLSAMERSLVEMMAMPGSDKTDEIHTMVKNIADFLSKISSKLEVGLTENAKNTQDIGA